MKGERIYLRNLTLDDAEALFAIASHPDVGIHAGWKPHASIEESKEVLEKILINENNFGIFLQDDDTLIGCLGIQPDPLRTAPMKNLGYWIGKDYWGNGYVPEAARLVLDRLFLEDKEPYVSINHFVENTRSRRVIEKLGFKKEGTLVHAYKDANGTVHDLVMYVLSLKDYEEDR
ncbi:MULTISPECIES: GNAT family N-acetyltransferase [unclassified Breznakia]|uniref:GNAT family N-acetyltransferase n=1 Tax=unclassified Breznakia TaxID=2623764 RepID=UPI002475A8CB|nr:MULTISPECIES: GNAT family N-acetyltransferase [unclassified Breznakia]MDH6368004.1 RimJ/RimL family protein N-acetyltransferase [Breznakia sp. PH1-1]MDH6405110.1 RimJ/RimL family protein N-acetyltransferase [Breznakia sp. PF1-11]MDH6412807.1 RimJ/RimL family protein N-acetyltransferase [Breznakia sp. PFB1-11]MDH6415167.1 RimJ/RimL family protein N-acetyltransferase [Breznakia sp. PFB1-14]MDH6417478.1 RimJ/RimL family protein N-acetyltransferase [Breznakia sp. PFB1-4]